MIVNPASATLSYHVRNRVWAHMQREHHAELLAGEGGEGHAGSATSGYHAESGMPYDTYPLCSGPSLAGKQHHELLLWVTQGRVLSVTGERTGSGLTRREKARASFIGPDISACLV